MKNLLKALQTASAAVGYVQKKGRNEFQQYNYVTESDVVAQTREALLECDLVLIPSVESVSHDEWGNTNILVNYTVHHTSSGESLTFRMAGAGNDRNSKGVGDKGIYKALTGCNKYALLKALQLATGDDPEDEKEATNHAPQNAPQTPPKAAVKAQTEEVRGEPDPYVIEPSKMNKDTFVEDVKNIILTFMNDCTTANNVRRFYTINSETIKLIEKRDAAAAADIVAQFKAKAQQLEKEKSK
jgi:hypothetical protein